MPGHEKPLVGILMGSKSDWETMKNVSETLEKFGVSSASGLAPSAGAKAIPIHPVAQSSTSSMTSGVSRLVIIRFASVVAASGLIVFAAITANSSPLNRDTKSMSRAHSLSLSPT